MLLLTKPDTAELSNEEVEALLGHKLNVSHTAADIACTQARTEACLYAVPRHDCVLLHASMLRARKP